jgi:hypothetical protein
MTAHDPLRITLNRRRLFQAAAVGAGAAASARLFVGPSVTAAPLRQAAGELTVGVTQTTFRTDPNRATIGMYPLNTNIFESLVRLTPDYQI